MLSVSIDMRHVRIALPALFRLAVILAVFMVALFFTAAAITRANFFADKPTQASPAVHANAN